jgi:hypothetical protein
MNSSQKTRRIVSGAVLCGGVIAAAVGLGSGAAAAAVPSAPRVPAAHAVAVDTGFAEFRPGYGFHPGHAYFGPRRYHNDPFTWFGPRPYGFRGYR